MLFRDLQTVVAVQGEVRRLPMQATFMEHFGERSRHQENTDKSEYGGGHLEPFPNSRKQRLLIYLKSKYSDLAGACNYSILLTVLELQGAVAGAL